ncbi:MAG: hypothetical protein ACRDQ1_18010, partial [Sciscionella sp.]
LALITYLLVAHALYPATATTIPRAIQQEIAQCVTMGQTRDDPAADIAVKCGGLYTQGVQAGAVAQRSTTRFLPALAVFGGAGVAFPWARRNGSAGDRGCRVAFFATSGLGPFERGEGLSRVSRAAATRRRQETAARP